MFRVCLTVGVLIVACCLPGAVSAAGLTLDDCITRALQHNYAVRIARGGQEIAEQGVVAARAGMLPTVQAAASSSEMDNAWAALLGSGIDGNNTALSVSVTQPLFTFGKRSGAYELAQLGVDDAVHAETVAANELVFTVTQTWYEALLASELAVIARDAYALADTQAQFAEKRFRHGYVSEFDLLRARTNRAGREPAIIAAENRQAIARTRMLTLLNDGSRDFAPRGDLAVAVRNLDETAAVQAALAANPQLARLRVGLARADRNVQYARSQHYPDLAANYTFTRQRTDYTVAGRDYPTGYHSDWAAGVTLNIPIFSGYATQAGVDKAEAEAQQLRDLVAQSEEQVALEVQTIVKNLREHVQVIRASEEAVQLAQRALRMARVSYDNGLSTTLDVAQAEMALTSARTDLAKARYGYLVNAAALDAVTGSNAAHIRAINPSASRGTTVATR